MLGRVTDEQYRMLAGDYTVEQKTLEEQIPEKEARRIIARTRRIVRKIE